MDINSRFARVLKKSALRPIAITGYRTIVRATHRSSAPPLMANTLAKAGTHLIMSLLDSLDDYQFSGRHFAFSESALQEPQLSDVAISFQRELDKLVPGLYMTGHLAYHDSIRDKMDSKGIKRIHVVRDPRALLVSGAIYMISHEAHPLHSSIVRRFQSIEQLVLAMLDGTHWDNGTPFNEGLLAFVPWLGDAEGVVLRFEDLVGPNGGGSREAQLAAVQTVMMHVGIAADQQSVERAADAAFDPRSATFQHGRIDGWRSHLSGDLLDYVEGATRTAAKQLGYQY